MKCVFNKSKPIFGLEDFADCNPLCVTPKTRKSQHNIYLKKMDEQEEILSF